MVKSRKYLFGLVLFLFSLLSCERNTMLVSTGDVSDLFSTSVKITGYIICEGEGIKKYGHCYSLNPDPTILDKVTESGSTIGIGTFTSFIINLKPATKYYARAYLSSENKTIYGNEITFVTTE